MELMNPWVKQGWEDGKKEGMQIGKEEIVVRLLNRRFGAVSTKITARLNHLTSEQLSELGEDLLDFKTVTDLETWLSQHHLQ